MDTEEDGAMEEQAESPIVSPSSVIGSSLNYVKSFIPGYSTSEDHTEPIEKIGDKLRKKRLKTKCRSSPINKRDYASNVVSSRNRNVGSNRSMVRYIGSNVPIAPSQRQYFELFDNSGRAFFHSASSFVTANLDHVRQHVDQVKYRVVPTLADIGQLVWDDLKVFDDDDDQEYEDYDEDEDDLEEQTEIETPEETLATTSKQPDHQTQSEQPSTSTKEPAGSQDVKISALEDELAKLRAQIAMIVSASSNTSNIAPMTSTQLTPVAIVAPTVTMPPPPPPLPPPATSTSFPRIEITKGSKKTTDQPTKPNMDDVLRGLSSVKLKSVPNRSPGGTPMRDPKDKHLSNDPADVIARALRDKFKNSKNYYNSPETETSPSSFSPSPKKHKKSPKVSSSHTRPVPRPRPRPRPRVQKKTMINENVDESEKTKLF